VPLPNPVPGLVLHYSYLWNDQHRRGLEEGTKNRPCVIVLSVTEEDGGTTVVVAPITRQPSSALDEAIEIPATTKHRLGLDSQRSWVIVTEVNRFRWPGHDLRPVPGGRQGVYSYGLLPPGLFRQVKTALATWVRGHPPRITPR
jgi:mRNA-degrading endonuclease toxin of MazEF toxin-antitoxin module